MPLKKTFWSPRFGMVQDRFGVLPEEFDCGAFSATRPSNELRPEFVDSCLALFVHGGGEHEASQPDRIPLGRHKAAQLGPVDVTHRQP